MRACTHARAHTLALTQILPAELSESHRISRACYLGELGGTPLTALKSD